VIRGKRSATSRAPLAAKRERLSRPAALLSQRIRDRRSSPLAALTSSTPREWRARLRSPSSHIRLWFLDHLAPRSFRLQLRYGPLPPGPPRRRGASPAPSKRSASAITPWAAAVEILVEAAGLRVCSPRAGAGALADLSRSLPDGRSRGAAVAAVGGRPQPFALALGPLLLARILRLAAEEARLPLSRSTNRLGTAGLASSSASWSSSTERREPPARRALAEPASSTPITRCGSAAGCRDRLAGSRLLRRQLAGAPRELGALLPYRARPALQNLRVGIVPLDLSGGARPHALRWLACARTTLFMVLLSPLPGPARPADRQDDCSSAPHRRPQPGRARRHIGLFRQHVVRAATGGRLRRLSALTRPVREAALGAFAHE